MLCTVASSSTNGLAWAQSDAAEMMSACVGSAAPVTSAAHLPAGMARLHVGPEALARVEAIHALVRPGRRVQ